MPGCCCCYCSHHRHLFLLPGEHTCLRLQMSKEASGLVLSPREAFEQAFHSRCKNRVSNYPIRLVQNQTIVGCASNQSSHQPSKTGWKTGGENDRTTGQSDCDIPNSRTLHRTCHLFIILVVVKLVICWESPRLSFPTTTIIA